MKNVTLLSIVLFSLNSFATAEDSFTFFAPGSELADMELRTPALPAGLTLPDIMEDLQNRDFAACEQKFLGLLPGHRDNTPIHIFILHSLGFYAQMQGFLANDDETERQDHLQRALGYLALGDSLAALDKETYKVEYASFIRDQSHIFRKTGRAREALSKMEELVGMTGVGTGTKADALAAGAVKSMVAVRLDLDHSNADISAWLDSLSGSSNPSIALSAKEEVVNMYVHSNDMVRAREALDKIKKGYADTATVGDISIQEIVDRTERILNQENAPRTAPHDSH